MILANLITVISLLTNISEKQSFNQKDSLAFTISYANKQVSNRGENIISYSIQNISVKTKIKVLTNPIIGYKSDDFVEGYFEIEEKKISGWEKYTVENSDYNYREKGELIELKPNEKIKGLFNLELLYSNFPKGEFKIRLALKSCKTSNNFIFSNWLAFKVD